MSHRQLNSDDLRKRFGLEINAPVFFSAAAVILLFVVVGIVSSEWMEDNVKYIQNSIATYSGWFFVLAVDVMLVFSVYLLFSRFGNIRLGGPDAETEFSTWAWLAMLFSAGMGIGLVFWSVAEPIYHFGAPPEDFGVEAGTTEAAVLATRLTFFHWGFHPWGIYAIVALSLAFFSYNRGLPLTIRSVFYPMLGKRVYGPIGHVIDTTAVVATLFGVATSLGFGAKQVAAGLHHVFGVPENEFTWVILIALITGMATISVVLGLDAGIRRLSEINMVQAAALLLVVFLLGPTLLLLNAYVQNIGNYLHYLPRLSTWTEAYSGGNWQNSWTVFYWAWWISWAPFVGMFIAQISRGRTIREFMLGVLFVPTALTFLWLTIFGNTAMDMALATENPAESTIVTAVNDNVAVALFVLLEQFPLATFTSIIAIAVIVLFFVTSSDSGSLVIDVITAGGYTDPPVAQRIFWAVTEGVVAAVLLVGGGLTALQTAAVSTGLPFTIVILFMCYGLYKGLERAMQDDQTVDLGHAPKEAPGKVETLEVPQHGRRWVVLAWDPPQDGGDVAAYLISRRHPEEEKWHEVAMCLEEQAVLHHREAKGEYDYQVTPVNRAGVGQPSDPVRVSFDNVRAVSVGAGAGAN